METETELTGGNPQSDVAVSLIRDCYAIFLIDCNSHRMETCRLDGKNTRLEFFTKEGAVYDEAMAAYMDKYAAKAEIDEKKKAVRFSRVKREIEKDGNYLVNFRRFGRGGKVTWHQMIFGQLEDASGPSKYVLAFRDVDEVVRAETEFVRERERQKQYRFDRMTMELIHESLNSGSWLLNFDDNGIVTTYSVSDVFTKMIGFEGTMVKPKDNSEMVAIFLKYMYEGDAKRVDDALNHAITDYSGKTVFDEKFRIKTNNRGIRWFHAAARISRKPDGTPIVLAGIFVDIDDEVKTEKELEEANRIRNEHMHVLSSMAGIYLSAHYIDLKNDTVYEYASSELVRSIVNSQYGAREMMKKVMTETVVPEFRDRVLEFSDLSTLSRRMKGKKTLSCDFIGIEDGWITGMFIAIDTDEDGIPESVLFTTRVIDEQKRAMDTLLIRSNTDELTGIYNRRAYEELLEEYRTGVQKPDNYIVVSADLNMLKQVNDSLGHAAGDEIIKAAAQCLFRYFAKFGKVFRTGGDEFMLILETDGATFKTEAEKFEKAVDEWKGTFVDSLSVSYGYVDHAEDTTRTIDDETVLADKRMYVAKASFYVMTGRDRRR